jgi:hypothetical protein
MKNSILARNIILIKMKRVYLLRAIAHQKSVDLCKPLSEKTKSRSKKKEKAFKIKNHF